MNARIDRPIFASPDLSVATLASGVRMPFVVSGSGAPLVFVHGSLCDYRYWAGQAEVLSKHFSCVSVSLSHYWPVPDGGAESPFSWSTHVAELAEFIAGMDAGPVHLVGHSRGGCVAFHLARQYPALVKTLTLADPAGPLQIDGVAEAALPPATIALRGKAAGLIESGEIEAGLELFVDSVSMPGIWRRSSANFRTMAIANAATLPMQFRDPLPAFTRIGATDVKCRTLLIGGEKSPRMYRDNIEKLAGWIGQVDKRSIAGASHGMNITHPRTFNRLIGAFVTGGD
ncbi:alpha/beta hydrolase [Massilia sp. R2A-15]|uniref:alpha/beta fold hydrolase n=1 Tax=Massilia sp. R2A-15 TaxID=3064278 RepID=UPI00273711E0|nr:alpha/beta hydrolase [Massilia sp. R2A-15]WLI90232.1 alpha/beta hydrolase [Massilia sp. R2A-15]